MMLVWFRFNLGMNGESKNARSFRVSRQIIFDIDAKTALHRWSGDPTAASLSLGATATHSYYFVIVPHGNSLDGGETHQSTFAALREFYP